MISWCAPTCPPCWSFVASGARRRGQVCTVSTRPDSTYKSGTAVQTTGTTSRRSAPRSGASVGFDELHGSARKRAGCRARRG